MTATYPSCTHQSLSCNRGADHIWIRYRYQIPKPELKQADEFTVNEVMKRFAVSRHVVYYWIDRGVVEARRLNNGSPYWIKINPTQAEELRLWVEKSPRIQSGNTTEP